MKHNCPFHNFNQFHSIKVQLVQPSKYFDIVLDHLNNTLFGVVHFTNILQELKYG
jgi:hypothetical protein